MSAICSISRLSLARTTSIVAPRLEAAATTSLVWAAEVVLLGFTNSPIRFAATPLCITAKIAR
jgi:hypothetical protein